MTSDLHARGGAAVAVLNRMEPWEANTVIHLRLWCDGPAGQEKVLSDYRRALPGKRAEQQCHCFECLLRTVIASAHRPLVRHALGCACVGADENILINMMKTAADGHLNDAALIATLLSGPAQAERIALLAGEVGTTARQIHTSYKKIQPEANGKVTRLH